VGCYIWYSEEGPEWVETLSSPLLAVPNVTAHPSMASVPVTVFLYDGPLLCGFNVAIKGLSVLVSLAVVQFFHITAGSTDHIWVWIGKDKKEILPEANVRKINRNAYEKPRENTVCLTF